MQTEEKIFLCLLSCIILAMVVMAFGFGAGSKTLPVISGASSALLLLFLIAVSFSTRLRRWYQKFETNSFFTKKNISPQETRRELSVVAWFSGCTALIYLAGFQIGIPAFLFLFLKLWAREGLLISVLLSGIVFAVIYFAFVQILMVPLHRGVLFG